ncbi:YjgN family protein [Endozoicomonas arenosclerae]|uniref:YjgN family protein n=1 Tax=Endozoicomonas arenosclerae TaxID=1633495 RepID=UPI000784A53D|nr:YjgN family protein [Endozoicomonas arenosclerae]
METGKLLPPGQEVHHHFEFTGKAGEFFRIWIVNVLLTVVTLGIYSAWAKVRTRRYFYGSTWVAGSSFSYLADPITILKGRLIGLGLLVAFSLANQYFPLVSLLLMPVILFVMPYIINKSLSFNARVSAWRNVRFKFQGSYWRTFLYFILLPIVTMVSLGLAFPWVIKKQKEYLVNHYSFGGEDFKAFFLAKAFYMMYLKVIMYITLFAIFIGLPIATFGNYLGGLSGSLIAMTATLIGYLITFAIVMAGTANIIYGNISVEEYRFESRQKATDLLLIYLTNVLAIVCTLGLAIPWAMIRLAQYRAESTTLLADEALDHFTDQAQEEQSAIAEEVGEVFDLAVGI